MNALQTLVDGIADAAFASEPGGMVVAWNAGAERMLGVPAAPTAPASCSPPRRRRAPAGSSAPEVDRAYLWLVEVPPTLDAAAV